MSTDVSIRLVTAESLAADLDARRLDVHPDIAEGLRGVIGDKVDFFIAVSPTEEPRGQVGINWVGAVRQQTRDALRLAEGETAPNIAFLEVTEGYRRQGVARLLLARVYAEILRRDHRMTFLEVAIGNVAARALYYSEGFVDTGVTYESSQFERNPDGTYGDPVIMTMLLLRKDLPSAFPDKEV